MVIDWDDKEESHDDDISIGKDAWLRRAPVEQDVSLAVNIDHIVSNCKELWRQIETDCVSACCGIDAYVFWPEDIGRATNALGKELIVDSLQETLGAIQSIESDVLASQILNEHLAKVTFVALTKHMLDCAKSA